MCGVDAELEKSLRISQPFDALPRSHPALSVLIFNRLSAPALANLLLLVTHLRHQVGEKTHIRFKTCRGWIDLGRQDVRRQGRVQSGRFVALSHESKGTD